VTNSMINYLQIFNETKLMLSSQIANVESIVRQEESDKNWENKTVIRCLYCKIYEYQLDYSNSFMGKEYLKLQ